MAIVIVLLTLAIVYLKCALHSANDLIFLLNDTAESGYYDYITETEEWYRWVEYIK